MHRENKNASLTDFCSKNDFSVHPDNPLSEVEFGWIFKKRATNGFSKAFVKISTKKFLVHLPTFVQCLSARCGK